MSHAILKQHYKTIRKKQPWVNWSASSVVRLQEIHFVRGDVPGQLPFCQSVV